jgi:hypothetical protein
VGAPGQARCGRFLGDEERQCFLAAQHPADNARGDVGGGRRIDPTATGVDTGLKPCGAHPGVRHALPVHDDHAGLTSTHVTQPKHAEQSTPKAEKKADLRAGPSICRLGRETVPTYRGQPEGPGPPGQVDANYSPPNGPDCPTFRCGVRGKHCRIVNRARAMPAGRVPGASLRGGTRLLGTSCACEACACLENDWRDRSMRPGRCGHSLDMLLRE